MSRSLDLYKEAKKVIPSGVTSPIRYFEPHPFFVKRSDGCYMWDTDKNKILDMCCGYGALLLGHRRREIVDAAAAQLKRGTLYCAPTSQETELASLIVRNFPSMENVRLVNTGGEATMTAIRLARGHTNRDKILKFQGCYHGAHDSVLVGAGSGATHYGSPTSAGVPAKVAKETLVAEYNDYDGVERIVSKHSNEIACVIVEPVMANIGLIPPRPDFLKRLRRLTKQNGIVLIFDEIVTGFRISPGGAQQHYGIRPDITTLAKALGNGFGIAAVGGDKNIMEQISPKGPVYQASTFGGNPVAVSAAIASIKTMNRIKGRMYPRLQKLCLRLAKAVGDIASEYKIPHRINSMSSMMQIFFTDGKVENYAGALGSDTAKFQMMFKRLLAKNVFVAPSQFEVVFLSNAHTNDDINRAIDAYDTGLMAIKRGE